MKKLLAILLALATFFAFTNVGYAQFSKLKQKVQDKVNQRVDQKTDKAIDNTLDSADAASKSNKTKTKTTPEEATNDNSQQQGPSTANQPTIKAYQNYDFVPGDKILFEDHFTDDQD